MNMQQNVSQIIEQVCEEVCDCLCAYRDTTDENLECQYVREGHSCPLDKLR